MGSPKSWRAAVTVDDSGFDGIDAFIVAASR
jgi:hypothetical protein